MLLALALSIGVSFKNISFNAALLYAVVPYVSPAFDAVAKPSISPSDNKSWIVANCLLFKVSGALVGDGGVGGGPPEPLIILSVMLIPD